MPGAQNLPQQQGGWVWDGSNWVCDPDCGNGSAPAPCPPFGPPVFSGPVNQPPWYPGANGGVSFGAVAPPNPVRGHMWWDGSTFWLFDGAAWVGVGGSSANAQRGVINGSDAAAGIIGEYLILTGSMPYAANPATTTQTVSAGVLPPGDWDLTCTGEYSTEIGVASFHLSPEPTGFSNAMWGTIGEYATAPSAGYFVIVGQSARASLSVPTLLAFSVTVAQTVAGLPAGTATVVVEARRAR
jgi:hypothetical protein